MPRQYLVPSARVLVTMIYANASPWNAANDCEDFRLIGLLGNVDWCGLVFMANDWSEVAEYILHFALAYV